MRSTSIMHRLILCLSLTILIDCTGSLPDNERRSAASKRASETVERLTSGLLGELTLAMKQGGPIRAIRYCSENAQNMTATVGKEMLLSVRRVTIKPRNPANAPDAWEAEVLNSFDLEARAGVLKTDIPYEEVMTLDGRRVLRSMKAIVLRDPCLVCHGTERDIPADVYKMIKERYPDDQATGYVSGDFRGAVSVIVPLPKE